jgi:uncharacterized membrane protein YbaN (DUF454 family)
MRRGPSSNPLSSAGPKPLGFALRWLLLSLGTVMAGLGLAGVFIPGLPTTPFVLVAVLCYARSSQRMLRWLISHRRLGPHAQAFLEDYSVPLRLKWTGLLMGWTFLGGAALFVADSFATKTLLLFLALAQAVAILSIKTTSSKPQPQPQPGPHPWKEPDSQVDDRGGTPEL